MMTDPIADMLTRIRNAALARHDRTEMPRADLKTARRRDPQVRRLHRRRPRRARARARRRSPSCSSTGATGTSAIDGIRRVSRPGRRVYVRHDRIPRVLSGLGSRS